MYVSCKEKCPERNVDLYTTFMDLTKAFYNVSWEDLWKIMTKFGCPEHFIEMVRQFHDGMQAQVLENSDSIHSVLSHQWSETRLCVAADTVQHDVHSDADRCLPGLRPRQRHQIQNREKALQPTMSPGQDQGPC